MCTLATSLILTAVGTGVSAYGNYKSTIEKGEAEARSRETQAMVERNNAESARRQAEMESQKGVYEAKAQAEKGRQFAARQRAILSSTGLDMGSGSALTQTVDTAGLTARDTLAARQNAQLRAWGYENEALNRQNAANIYNMQAGDIRSSSKSAARAGLFTSLLGGASALSNQWLWAQNFGGLSQKAVSDFYEPHIKLNGKYF